MIKLLGKLPKECYVACSGGADSMAALHFLTKDGKRDVTALHFNHGTPASKHFEGVVRRYCEANGIMLISQRIYNECPSDKSMEEHWRDERYNFFDNFTDAPIIMAHNLDDCVETYIFSTLHGTTKLIPYQRNNVIRPFMLTEKETLLQWCLKHEVEYLDDPCNFDNGYSRVRIRQNVLPELYKVQPGLRKVVSKKVNQNYIDIAIQERLNTN
jgi:tRNA(Ile)-lysidine synthase